MQTSGQRLTNSNIITSGFDYEKKRRELIRKISNLFRIVLQKYFSKKIFKNIICACLSYCEIVICYVLDKQKGDEIDEIDEIDENTF